ncbi:MAG: hypothetical protein ACWGQW_21285 [bacterium]
MSLNFGQASATPVDSGFNMDLGTIIGEFTPDQVGNPWFKRINADFEETTSKISKSSISGPPINAISKREEAALLGVDTCILHASRNQRSMLRPGKVSVMSSKPTTHPHLEPDRVTPLRTSVRYCERVVQE